MRFPSPDVLAVELALRHEAPTNEGGVEVRVQVLEDGRAFVHSGDPSQDPDSRGYWAATTLPDRATRFDVRKVAESMLAVLKSEHDQATKSPGRFEAQRELARTTASLGSSVANQNMLGVGDTIETEGVRIHRYADHFTITDLTHAGKRGKTCAETVARPTRSRVNLDGYALALVEARSYSEALRNLDDALLDTPDDLEVTERALRGVDVKPAGSRPLLLETTEFSLTATPTSFMILDKRDAANQPACTSRRTKQAAAFYAWIDAHQDAARRMAYGELLRAMMAAGLGFHDYCRM